MMKASEFIKKLKDVADNHKTVYGLGMFGQPITESIIKQKTKQLPAFYTDAKQAELRNLIGKGYFGFDCVCLIKGILWGWNGDLNQTNGGAKYCSNGVPDISDSGMMAVCTDVSTDFSNIIPGEFVWMSGHCGIYIGNGVVIECTPKWDNDVQYSNLGNIGNKKGNYRTWTKHGKLPYVDYSDVKKEEKPSTSTVTDSSLKIGDVVEFTGNTHYTSSYATGVAKPCKGGKATVTAISKGKPHPYCLVAVSGGGATVHGWVNVEDIKGNTTTSNNSTICVGDIVKYSGTVHYTSSYPGAIAKPCKGGTAKVIGISKGKPHPYCLQTTEKGCTVHGWVDADKVSK